MPREVVSAITPRLYKDNAAAPAITAPNRAINEEDERATAPPVLVVAVFEGEDALFVPVDEALVIVAREPVPDRVDETLTVLVPVPVPVPVVETGAPDAGAPVVEVVPLPGAPCNWPLPLRYAGMALYSDTSLKCPTPQPTLVGSVSGAGTEEPSVPVIVKRVTHWRLVGSAGEENW